MAIEKDKKIAVKNGGTKKTTTKKKSSSKPKTKTTKKVTTAKKKKPLNKTTTKSTKKAVKPVVKNKTKKTTKSKNSSHDEILRLEEQHKKYEVLLEEYNKEIQTLESLRKSSVKNDSQDKSDDEKTESLSKNNEDNGLFELASNEKLSENKNLDSVENSSDSSKNNTQQVSNLSEVSFYKPDAEVEENIQKAGKRVKKKDIKTYEYEDENLSAIEYARQQFNNEVKKQGIIKWIVSTVLLVGLFLGWYLPGQLMKVPAGNKTPLYITLGVCIVCIVGIFLFSSISKKKMNEAVDNYFDNLYDFTNSYVFQDLDITNIEGSGHKKVDESAIANTNLYKNVVSAPNRACYTFTYNQDMSCSICDCSCYVEGQKKGQRRPVFVGKMLTSENNWKKPETIIYIKGNKRALPPTNLDAYHLIEETKDMIICCEDHKTTLNNIDKSFIKKIKTNKTLVDCAIKISKGTTTFMLGYEDTLMIPAHQTPFNPYPTMQLKSDLESCLEVAEHFNK